LTKQEKAGGVAQMHVRMSVEEHVKLRQMLIEDQISFQELATMFVQSYLRGDRITRLLLHGHRDARVATAVDTNTLLSQKDKDEIVRELEKINKGNV
jgi:hypothetical protein